MPASIKVYHVVEDRSNINEVQAKAPFCCERADAWLGEGYYFWDTRIADAKWWGESSYGAGNYIVCQFYIRWPSALVLDLLGDLMAVQDVWECYCELKKQYPNKKITIAFIIGFLKDIGEFPYEAIRAQGGLNRNDAIPFAAKKAAVCYYPPQKVQICLPRLSLLQDGCTIVDPTAELARQEWGNTSIPPSYNCQS